MNQYCSVCGALLEEGSAFCCACGAPVPPASPVQPPMQPPVYANASIPQQPIQSPKKNKKKMLLIMAAVVLVLAISVVLFFIFRKHPDDSGSTGGPLHFGDVITQTAEGDTYIKLGYYNTVFPLRDDGEVSCVLSITQADTPALSPLGFPYAGSYYQIGFDNSDEKGLNESQCLWRYYYEDDRYLHREVWIDGQAFIDAGLTISATGTNSASYQLYGRYLYFVHYSRDGNSGPVYLLYRFDLENRSIDRVGDLETSRYVVSDDRIYYFPSSENGYALFSAALDGSDSRLLYRSPEILINSALLQGREGHVCILSKNRNTKEYYITEVDTATGADKVVFHTDIRMTPAYAMRDDGLKFYFTKMNSDNTCAVYEADLTLDEATVIVQSIESSNIPAMDCYDGCLYLNAPEAPTGNNGMMENNRWYRAGYRVRLDSGKMDTFYVRLEDQWSGATGKWETE